MLNTALQLGIKLVISSISIDLIVVKNNSFAEEAKMKIHRYCQAAFGGILIALFCLSSGFASETRVASMGNTGLFIHDNSNVVLFPGSLYLYGNEVITEFRFKGDPNTFTAAVHLPFGDQAFGGIRLNRNLTFPVPTGITQNINLDSANDLVLGLKAGENNFGLRGSFTFKDSKTPGDTTLPGTDESIQYYEGAAGVSGRYYDFGIYFNLPTIKSTVGALETKWDGFGFGGSGRYYLGLEDGIMYVPAFIVNSLSADLNDPSGVTKTDFFELRFALGFHYQVNKTNLIVLGIEPFGYAENKNDGPGGIEKTRTTNLPAFYLGGETHAKNWLILRLGATYQTQEVKVTMEPVSGVNTESSIRDSQFNLAVGVGFRIGKFLADFDINDNFLFEGPDFISGHGSGQSEDLFNRLSITYNF